MTDAAKLQAASQAARKKTLGAPAKRTDAEFRHLYNICGEGDYSVAKRLLNEPGWEINRTHGAVGWTLLHYAAYNGHDKIIKLLLIKGARSDLVDVKGWKAVDYASRENHQEAVHVLQDEKAIGEILAAVASRKQKQAEAVAKAPEVKTRKKHYLAKPEEASANTDESGLPKRPLQEVVELLLKHGADPNMKDLCGQTPLDCARRLSKPIDTAVRDEVVEMLVRAAKNRPPGRGGDSRYARPASSQAPTRVTSKPSHRSAENNSSSSNRDNEVDLLRAELVALAVKERTASKARWEERFFECAGNGDVEGMEDVLDDDADAALQCSDAFRAAVDGVAEGMDAATMEAVGTAQALWEMAGAEVGNMKVNSRMYKAQRSPLHAAAYAKQPDAVAFLLRHGAEVNKKDYIGRTPLAAAFRVRFY